MYNKKAVEKAVLKLKFDVKNWSDYHVGLYKKEESDLFEGLVQTIERMVRIMPNIKKSSRILILTNDNSVPAVYLGANFGSKIDLVIANDKSVKGITKDLEDHEISDTVTVHNKQFSASMFTEGTFDVIWSMDDLHTVPDKRVMIREAARLLVPEGRFIFSDYTVKGHDDKGEGESYVTSKSYLKLADKADLERVYHREMPADAIKHFNLVLEEAKSKKIAKKEIDAIEEKIKMLESGDLEWAFFQFQKRNV